MFTKLHLTSTWGQPDHNTHVCHVWNMSVCQWSVWETVQLLLWFIHVLMSHMYVSLEVVATAHKSWNLSWSIDSPCALIQLWDYPFPHILVYPAFVCLCLKFLHLLLVSNQQCLSTECWLGCWRMRRWDPPILNIPPTIPTGVPHTSGHTSQPPLQYLAGMCAILVST